MTDRWMQAANSVIGDRPENIPPIYWLDTRDAIATALSSAVRDEREACAKIADSEKAVWDGDFSIMAFSARKAAEDIAAAIHARTIEDVKK